MKMQVLFALLVLCIAASRAVDASTQDAGNLYRANVGHLGQMLAPTVASLEDVSRMEKEASSVLQAIIRILRHFIIPLFCLVTIIFGIARAITRGELLFFFVACAAAIILAISPGWIGDIGNFNSLK